MKFNEAPEQKKMRLKRCLVALSEAGVGKPNFVGMEVGKPIQINWQGEAIDIEVEDGTDEVAVRVGAFVCVCVSSARCLLVRQR